MVDVAGMPRRKREILRALEQGQDWMNRYDLADQTGKRKLSPNDVNHLEALVGEELVVKENLGTPERPEYRYRIASTEGVSKDV